CAWQRHNDFSQLGGKSEGATPEVCCIAELYSAKPRLVGAAWRLAELADCKSAIQQIENLRYGDTANCSQKGVLSIDKFMPCYFFLVFQYSKCVRCGLGFYL